MNHIKSSANFDLKDLRKHFAIILFLALAFVTYLVMRPFLLSLIVGAILAFIFFPAYAWLNRFIKNKALCSFIVTILILVLLSIPITFLMNIIAKEAYSVYASTTELMKEGNLLLSNINCTDNTHVACQLLENAESNLNPEITNQIGETITSITQTIVKGTAGFIASIPGKIIQFVVTILTMFILFIDGPVFAQKLNYLIPLTKRHKKKINFEFSNIVNGVIYGQILTAIVQGIVASIGFTVFGVESPIIWGLFTAFFSLIPFLGAAGVWFPISLFKFLVSLIQNDPIGIGKSIGLALYGFFIISLIDNFIKPKFIGDRAKLNAILALTSILGGLALWGLAGVIIGPVVIALFVSVVNIYIGEVKNIN